MVMFILLIAVSASLFPVIRSLDEEHATPGEQDTGYFFAAMCGDLASSDNRTIVRYLRQEHPQIRPHFESFLQNTAFVGQLLVERAKTTERRHYIRGRVDSLVDWVTELGLRPYHLERRVYIAREDDCCAGSLRQIHELIQPNYTVSASNGTMGYELDILAHMNAFSLVSLSESTAEIAKRVVAYNAIFAMIFRPYTHTDIFSEFDRVAAVFYMRSTVKTILEAGEYSAEMHSKLLDALKQLQHKPAPQQQTSLYALLALCAVTSAAVFFSRQQIQPWFDAARSTVEQRARLRLLGLLGHRYDCDEELKKTARERRQLEQQLQKAQRQYQSATDRNKPLEQRLRSAEETVAQVEAAKDRALLKESELNIEVERLMSQAGVHAQEKRELQTAHALAQAKAAGREYELTKKLGEQCRISRSLNEDVERMHRLIREMTDANDAMMATSEPTSASSEDMPNANDNPAASQDGAVLDVPSDPAAEGPVTPSQDEAALEQFIMEVYATLYSRPNGYDSIPWLLRDLRNDSDLDGTHTARSLGYDSFETFLQSPEMAPRVIIANNAESTPLYKVYPAKADLGGYVAQQVGTDYRDTKRSLAFVREENSRLRNQLAATLERQEKLKAEALKPKVHQASSRSRVTAADFRKSSGDSAAVASDRFRRTTIDADTPSSSRSVLGDSGVQEADGSGKEMSIRTRLDNLERSIQCGICMDRPKDTAFACGHTYCDQCATDLNQCTFGCKKANDKPLAFKYRIFL